MANKAAFSRLQLAAALLEYDNDPENPDVPYRSAQDSAIFAHFRRNPAARPGLETRKSDYLSVALPSETASLGGRESNIDTRRRLSKGSIDALRNPFGADGQSELELNEEEEEVGLEVDLQSWGLDAFMPKEKKSAKAKGKQPAVNFTRSRLPSTSHDSMAEAPRRAVVTSKSMSLGGHIELENATLGERRRSFGSPLDLAGMEATDLPLSRRRATSEASLLSQPVTVPFPTGSIRPLSPGVDQVFGDSRPTIHSRTYSMASMNSKLLLDDAEQRQRNDSIGTLDMLKPAEDNPFAIEHLSHTSRFDPKAAARIRSHSNASLGSRMMLENDGASAMTRDPYARDARDRPYSTLELLRPKVLVMPSPLQSISNHHNPESLRKFRDGFEMSTDGPPLPPGAKSTRRLSSSLSVFDAVNENLPVASNSFTPNPLMDLTLSQKTFRNTLAVGAQSSPYIDSDIPRATEDGEQAKLDPNTEENLPMQTTEGPPSNTPSRPAGKLYGKSLIDDLESRKAQMRSKQRVFKGDQRPSMMARDQQRSSTLIDPASLQARPSSQRMSSYASQDTQQNLTKRGSLTAKPLLNFDTGENKLSPNTALLPATRSVFGVDTLWEREMVKLKEIQAREEIEEEKRRKKEEEEERRRQEKKNKRKQGKGSPEAEEPAAEIANITTAPPILPNIERATRRAPPKPSDSDISSDSEEESPVPVHNAAAPSWHVGSSDEEDTGPPRTTGVGLRYLKSNPPDDDSEEDLPLVATIHKAVARATFSSPRAYAPGSDDEDTPLSHVLQAKSNTSPIRNKVEQTLNLASRSDEDDEPLGLRASRIPSSIRNAEDEDDTPLAFHPDQQRRTQYQMLAHQQQQQQMMMQAQMQSSMMMNASMMGSFYGPPMMNPMAMMPMQVPMQIPSPPPIADEAKFGMVDRWRRDVAVDGENI